jgi:hypothetical protein
MDVRGAGFGQPIGVSGCHHQLGNQVNNHLKYLTNFFSLFLSPFIIKTIKFQSTTTNLN